MNAPAAPLRVRADLAGASPYVAGETEPGLVKLSSNETGFPPLPGVSEALAAAAAEIGRYPDNNATTLRTALAAHWQVDLEEVIVGCGSSLLCQELIQATCEPGDRVAFGWRSFEAYQLYARTAHAEALTVPNRADGRLDLPGLARAIRSSEAPVGIVFLCTPNNPTGATIGPEELRRFLGEIPPTLPVVVDEAYQEFASADALDAIEAYREGHRNVVTLRTFSKAYGLAGLRVGYAIGSPSLLAAVHAIRSPFSITAGAQAAAVAALAAHGSMVSRAAVIRAERERVRNELIEHGISTPRSNANFLWLPLAKETEPFTEHCRSEGVLVRRFASDGVRVTISTPDDNEQFLTAMKSWSRGRGKDDGRHAMEEDDSRFASRCFVPVGHEEPLAAGVSE